MIHKQRISFSEYILRIKIYKFLKFQKSGGGRMLYCIFIKNFKICKNTLKNIYYKQSIGKM